MGGGGSSHGGEVEQAAQLGVAMFAEAELATTAAGLTDADIEADVGDDLVGVGERLVDEPGREGGCGHLPDARDGQEGGRGAA